MQNTASRTWAVRTAAHSTQLSPTSTFTLLLAARHSLLHVRIIAGSVTLVHFNDVYEIESGKKEPVGGAARFAAKLKEVTAAGDREPGLLTT
jgi:hypothetical protein